jgi:hypothetical protein
MIAVHYPEPAFRVKQLDGKRLIFDPIRKCWLQLTEEEWVRQNFIQYLVTVLKYPLSLIAIEKEIILNDLKKRFDILVYNKVHQPWMMIECKEPRVSLDETVLQQVLRYNISVPVQYLVITNGPVTLAWKKEGDGLQMLEALPVWDNA